MPKTSYGIWGIVGGGPNDGGYSYVYKFEHGEIVYLYNEHRGVKKRKEVEFRFNIDQRRRGFLTLDHPAAPKIFYKELHDDFVYRFNKELKKIYAQKTQGSGN